MKKMTLFLACLAAFAMVFGFTVTAAMADADLYGSIRFRTYWSDRDKDYTGTGYDDEDLEWKIGYLSRWGVNYQSGDIKGKVELDCRDSVGNDGSSSFSELRVRHIYGEWDFGMGKLLIGQTFNPYTVYQSGIGYFSGGLQKFGGMGLSYFRTSQIRLTFGNLQLAFLTPDTDEDLGFADTDTTIPRMEARYTLKLDPLTLDFIGGYQTYDVVSATDHEESVDSYVAGLAAKANFGPAYVKGEVTYRQNGDNYGVWTVVEESAVYENGSVRDADCYGAGLVAGYKINDMFTVEASYNMVSAENDDRTGKWEDDASVFALLCKITPAPGVVIQPEFIYEDQEDKYEGTAGKTEQGDNTVFGVFWVINFK